MLAAISVIVVWVGGGTPGVPDAALERAARSALGPETSLLIRPVDTDPDDQDSIALAGDVDAVVELVWSPDDDRARLHCYLSNEQRWVEREIRFGTNAELTERDLNERGRLLGFAVATMLTHGAEPAEAVEESRPEPRKQSASAKPPEAAASERSSPPPAVLGASARPRRHALEFAGILSSGIGGAASELGAMAGIRLALTRPFAFHGSIAGRVGSIPEAQATTQTWQLGLGLSLGLLPATSRWEAGLRADGILSYFEAFRLSEGDTEPDRQRRVLGGADLVAEGAFRLTDSVAVCLGGGLEVMFGSTEVLVHGVRVAVVSPFRAVAELGFRTYF